MSDRTGPRRPPKERTPEAADSGDRDDMRPALHEENHREAAAARAREILEHLGGDLDGNQDEFFIPEERKKDGWDYIWRRASTLNQPDHTNISEAIRMGWQYVDPKEFPELVPSSWKEKFVEKKGLRLMTRPMEISNMVRRREREKALQQVQARDASLRNAPLGNPEYIDRTNAGAPISPHGVTGVKKSWESVPIPK